MHQLLLNRWLLLQVSSFVRCKSRESRRPRKSQWVTTWPPSCPDASPWNTVNQMRTLSRRRTSGPIEARGARSATIMLLLSIPAHSTHSSDGATEEIMTDREARKQNEVKRHREREFGEVSTGTFRILFVEL